MDVRRFDSWRWARPGVVVLALGAAGCDDAPTDPSNDGEPWPSTEACEGLDTWPQARERLEAEALARIEEVRAEGADCGARGKLGPAPSLRRRTALDCAARSHALDMATRGYFSRLDPDGADERERVEAAGYAPAVLVQHLAAGPRDAEALIDQTWLPRPVPCSSLASSALTEVGLAHVGELEDEGDEREDELGTRWVLLLAGDETGDAP